MSGFLPADIQNDAQVSVRREVAPFGMILAEFQVGGDAPPRGQRVRIFPEQPGAKGIIDAHTIQRPPASAASATHLT